MAGNITKHTFYVVKAKNKVKPPVPSPLSTKKQHRRQLVAVREEVEARARLQTHDHRARLVEGPVRVRSDARALDVLVDERLVREPTVGEERGRAPRENSSPSNTCWPLTQVPFNPGARRSSRSPFAGRSKCRSMGVTRNSSASNRSRNAGSMR